MSQLINAAPINEAQNFRESHEVSLPHQDRTAGSNAVSAAHSFEQRCTQEVGTH